MTPEWVLDAPVTRPPLQALAARPFLRRLRLSTVPVILFTGAEADDASGCYYHPGCGIWLTTAGAFSARAGLVVVGNAGDEDEANTLAHELRHAWQFERGKVAGGYGVLSWEPDDYHDSMRAWAKDPCERDATRWANRVAASPHGRWLAAQAGWH